MKPNERSRTAGHEGNALRILMKSGTPIVLNSRLGRMAVKPGAGRHHRHTRALQGVGHGLHHSMAGEHFT
jgi:hypothetical protein